MPPFRAPEMLSFVKIIEKTRVKREFLPAICAVMRSLDAELDTPSVIVRGGRVLTPKPIMNGHTRLATIPLYIHSLNCAVYYIKHNQQSWGGSSYSANLLAILAHDIGKLRICRPSDGYKSATHPELGAQLLEQIIGDTLWSPLKERICEAVALHHKKKQWLEEYRRKGGGEYMPLLVAEIDQRVRVYEAARAISMVMQKSPAN